MISKGIMVAVKCLKAIGGHNAGDQCSNKGEGKKVMALSATIHQCCKSFTGLSDSLLKTHLCHGAYKTLNNDLAAGVLGPLLVTLL